MESFQLLTLSLGLLFGLGLLFSILLWCKSWRREELEAYQTNLRQLSDEVSRLREAVELLDHTAASLQTADGQLSEQIEGLRSVVGRARTPAPADPPASMRDRSPENVQVKSTVTPAPGPAKGADSVPPRIAPRRPAARATEVPDTKTQVRTLLAQGRSETEIARDLDMGLAEVRMIARMAESK